MANGAFPNSGSGADYVDGVKVEGDALWQGAIRTFSSIGGTANAVTAVSVPAITAYADGQRFRFRPTSDATGAMTMAIDGLAAKDVVDRNGDAIIQGLINSGGTYILEYVSALGDLVAIDIEPGLVGRQKEYTRADLMVPRTTNGAAAGSIETTTNKVMLKTLDFDQSTDEFAQFSFLAPKRWDLGAMKAKFVWTHSSGSTNFDVTWGIQGLALSNDDAADAAFGTAQTVSDTGGTAEDIYISAETANFTLGGTPAQGDLLIFQVYRDADAVPDNLNADARLIGVMLYWNSITANEA